jgi:hypothetical protein
MPQLSDLQKCVRLRDGVSIRAIAREINVDNVWVTFWETSLSIPFTKPKAWRCQSVWVFNGRNCIYSENILKIVKSMCNCIKKIKWTLTKCHTNVNSTPPPQLPHRLSYTVATLIHNHFESPHILWYQIEKQTLFKSINYRFFVFYIKRNFC